MSCECGDNCLSKEAKQHIDGLIKGLSDEEKIMIRAMSVEFSLSMDMLHDLYVSLVEFGLLCVNVISRMRTILEMTVEHNKTVFYIFNAVTGERLYADPLRVI